MSWLIRLWAWLLRRLRPRSAPFATASVEDLPDDLRPRTIYLAGEGGHRWCAALLCPCGCGQVIQLNLLKAVRPCWSVTEHGDGSVSIEPSVWRQKGCRSHFFLRHGRVEWFRAAGDHCPTSGRLGKD